MAWVFVALLLGVCIGWLTFSRGRPRWLDALIWIVAGLAIASPVLWSTPSIGATALGTLVALFYFVGSPLGWFWRQGAGVVARSPAARLAPGYVFRGRPPARSSWQFVAQGDPRMPTARTQARDATSATGDSVARADTTSTHPASAASNVGVQTSAAVKNARQAAGGAPRLEEGTPPAGRSFDAITTFPASDSSAAQQASPLALGTTPAPVPAEAVRAANPVPTSAAAATDARPAASGDVPHLDAKTSPSAASPARENLATAQVSDTTTASDFGKPPAAPQAAVPSASTDASPAARATTAAASPSTTTRSSVATDRSTSADAAPTSGSAPGLAAPSPNGQRAATGPAPRPESGTSQPSTPSAIATPVVARSSVETAAASPSPSRAPSQAAGLTSDAAPAAGSDANPLTAASTPSSQSSAPTSVPPSTSAQPIATTKVAGTDGALSRPSASSGAATTAPTATSASVATSAAQTAPPPSSPPVPDQHKHPGVRPPGFVTAREDKADDLQLIRGIGPQNEGRLHKLGIWHFDQIGAWTADEIHWVGSYLAFPGRIDREKWVEQARNIAAGAIIPKAAGRRPARPR